MTRTTLQGVNARRRSPFEYENGHLPTDEVVYSDRLYQWDSEKYNASCMAVWGNRGQYFYQRSPESIEMFLSLYFGREVILTAIEVEENASSGYPYWAFYFRNK